MGRRGSQQHRQKIFPRNKTANGLYCVIGRLGKKAYKIKNALSESSSLAQSCRKRQALTDISKGEQAAIAAVQAKNHGMLEEAEPLQELVPSAMASPRDPAGRRNTLKPVISIPKEKKQVEEDTVKLASDSMTVFEAFDLATEFNLPAGHVTQAFKLFKRYDVDNDGLIHPTDFQLLLRCVLRERFPNVKDVPRELLKEAVEIQKTNVMVSFPDFLTWLTQNSFNESMLLNDDQRFIRRIARRFGVTVPDIEFVKARFDEFDVDKSGSIEYSEFYALLGVLLNLTDLDSLPESRVKSFWRELDDDNSGNIDFQEFIPWYIGYFGGWNGSPLVNFYRKIRPNPWHDFD